MREEHPAFLLPPPSIWSCRPARDCLGKRAGKSSLSLRWPALQSQPAPRTGWVPGAPSAPGGEEEPGVWGAGGLVRTEEAVVLPGALHAAVGQDLQVEARAAVELPAA